MFYTVQSSEPIADNLAQWLLKKYGDEPDILAKAIVLLPSNRVIGTVRDAFLRASNGKAIILPQLIVIGDIDETIIMRHANPRDNALADMDNILPPPQEMERLLLLQDLVWQYGKNMIPTLHDREAALDLAINLADFMDEMDREQGDWSQLDKLAPDDFAEHWQQTLEFMQIIRQYWPHIEIENGWQSSGKRRNKLLTILAECWQSNNPKVPVIAAGTTGSVPAVSNLLSVINDLPDGVIVLPGFDVNIKIDELPQTHPQYAMQSLILSAGIVPSDVEELPVGEFNNYNSRLDLLSFAMSPADDEESYINDLDINIADALSGSRFIEVDNSHDLSLSAALLMRESLENIGKTAALITPDRQLARAVSAHLMRWDILVDDSAGQPLSQAPQSVFIFLLLELLRYGIKPVSLLALTKHPLFRIGHRKEDIYASMRDIESKVLRKISAPTWQKIKNMAADKCSDNVGLLNEIDTHLSDSLSKFNDKSDYSFIGLLDELIELAEVLTTDEIGECHLWYGQGSAELSDFLSRLRAADYKSLISPEELPGMLRALMRTSVVRSSYGNHPRLRIISPMEARLQSFDRVIIADLNEGGFPQAPEADAWINRQMRHQLGLPSPDKRIGQQAHDFIQQASGGDVFFMRSKKAGGAEAIKSRFMQRIELAIEKFGGSDNFWKAHPVKGWLLDIYNPENVPPITRPMPKPPLNARPRKLSVTSIERLMQDPYSIYAQKILRFNKLDELEPEPSHKEFGNIVHNILELYFTKGGDIMDCARSVFAGADMGYIANSLWLPRFQQIAHWILSQPLPQEIKCEVEGQWKFVSSAGDFVLTAKVDRIDQLSDSFTIIDYKTGAPPTPEWMVQGFASQLTLAAIIAKQGGFGVDLSKLSISGLQYWKLGGKNGGKISSFVKGKEETFEDVVVAAQEALPKIIAAYDNEDKAYEAIPEYRFKPKYNDYEHLARINEWLD